jgi:hypothetical protein
MTEVGEAASSDHARIETALAVTPYLAVARHRVVHDQQLVGISWNEPCLQRNAVEC